MKSDYFGRIEKGIMGITPEYKFSIPYFGKDVGVYLDLEYDDDGNEIETLPTDDEILEYEYTLKNFIENIDGVINDIKEKAFRYYKEEKEPYGYGDGIPLINNAYEHFKYMKDLQIRVLKDKRILLQIINYEIDEEHAMEILLKDNLVYKIAEAGGYVLYEDE